VDSAALKESHEVGHFMAYGDGQNGGAMPQREHLALTV